MKFVLSIDIEPDTSRKDVALALRRAAANLERTQEPLEDGDSAPVRDPEGGRVGIWEVAS